MHLVETTFYGNPNLGVFGYATDKICLLGKMVQDNLIPKIEKVLNVPVHFVDIAGTSLVGTFVVGNSKGIIVPAIIFDHEIEHLKELGLNFMVLDTKLTALGNNIVANDHGAIASVEFPKEEIQKIQDFLGVPVVQTKIAGLDVIGSMISHNNKGCLMHPQASEEEVKLVERVLKVKAMLGTINLGNPYVSSGIIANSNGFLIGSTSGGPELVNADQALGFLDF